MRIARQFGREYFDGDRCYGYGGYSYQPRFWQPVFPDFQRHDIRTFQFRTMHPGTNSRIFYTVIDDYRFFLLSNETGKPFARFYPGTGDHITG